MQFIKHGPDIPERLLQSQEEGQVVFFCGAGISYPAGLPGFGRLVENIYNNIGTDLEELEQKIFKKKLFDQTLALLERRVTGGRETVRKALYQSLQPNLNAPAALDTHIALLQLSTNNKEKTRLITTNFDRLFFEAASSLNKNIPYYSAPHLPIPKKSRWNGIVYLHGLLPNDATDIESLNSLVLTSGDFGLAYLQEAWAARFISDVLRDYDICFVGYSIDDPILRYMMDALSADQLMGEDRNRHYWAFAGVDKNSTYQKTAQLWKLKNVIPILYRTRNYHRLLHQTLHVWAEHYCNGLLGKKSIIGRYTSKPPTKSTQQDNYVGRVLWAISDPTGEPAKHFAEQTPPPSLEWLTEVFVKKEGILKNIFSSSKLTTSKITLSLIPWFEHLSGNPDFLLFILSQPEDIQNFWRKLFYNHLNIENLSSQSPEPQRKYIQKLFSLFIYDRLQSSSFVYEKFNQNLLQNNTPTLYKELSFKEALTSRISLRKNFYYSINKYSDSSQKHFPFIHRVALKRSFPDILEDTQILEHPKNINIIQYYLQESLDILSSLEDKQYSPLSNILLPSIENHSQNTNKIDGLAYLMELLRDAWEHLRQTNRQQAIQIATTWFDNPYPIFKRFALYAAAQDNIISPLCWGNFLLQKDTYWLWSPETKREVCRLLAQQGKQLSATPIWPSLEKAILAGIPRNTFNMTDQEYDEYNNYAVWLRLKKLSPYLSPESMEKVKQIESLHPDWKLHPTEREEFAFWIGTSREQFDDPNLLQLTTTEEISSYIKKHNDSFFPHNAWEQLCQQQPHKCLRALQQLCEEDFYPTDYWIAAVFVWSEEIIANNIYERLSSWVIELTETHLQYVADNISWWLEKVSAYKSFSDKKDSILKICQRLITLQPTERSTFDTSDELLNQALNSSQGRAAEIIFRFWLNTDLSDDIKISSPYKELFNELCSNNISTIAGKVFLGRYSIVLYRTDPIWASEFLIPLFDWNNNVHYALAVWSGFLWQARSSQELLQLLQKSLIDSRKHLISLGQLRTTFVELITRLLIEAPKEFNSLKQIINAFSEDDLVSSLTCVANMIEEIDNNRRRSFLENKILPFFKKYWPKNSCNVTSKTSEAFAKVCLASQEDFSFLWPHIDTYISSISNPSYIISELNKSEICTKSPKEVLEFLNKIYCENAKQDFSDCLIKIKSSYPSYKDNRDYNTLIKHFK